MLCGGAQPSGRPLGLAAIVVAGVALFACEAKMEKAGSGDLLNSQAATSWNNNNKPYKNAGGNGVARGKR